MKLSDYAIDFIAQLGVRHAFVLSGGASIHLIDSVARHPKMTYVCPLHEQSGAMMADGYARVSGGFGCAIATSGPGATNLITGIACSWFDSIANFFITGQVASTRLAKNPALRQLGFQETDIVHMVKKITKYAVQIRNPEDIRFELEKAAYLAQEGRPGPVLIDIPDDLQRAEIDPFTLRAFTRPEKPSVSEKLPSQVRQAVQLLQQAERPLIVLGAATVLTKREKQAVALLRKLQVPFAPTWATLHLMEHGDPLFAGGFGISSPRFGNFAIQNCDFLLSIGSRLDTHATGSPLNSFARAAKKVVVDLEYAELSKFAEQGLHIDLPILADVRDFLDLLEVETQNLLPTPRTAWLNQIAKWKNMFPVCSAEYGRIKNRVEAYVFLHELSKHAREDATVFVDCGGNLTQTAQGFQPRKNQKLFTALNNSPMGYALAGSIGACLALDRREILCLIGDCGLLMNIHDLATVRQLDLPIKIFVFNNHGHGIVRQTQSDWLEGRWESTSQDKGLPTLDRIAIAESFGIPALQISDHQTLMKELPGILERKGPVLIDLDMGVDQKTIPMLKAGRPIEDASPLLARKTFLEAMLIQPLPVSLEPI